MATSPSIKNYTIPTGSATFTPTAGSPRSLGNIVSFSVAHNVTTKPHYRNYGGKRKQDATRVTLVAATVKFTLDEITGENVRFFALGDISTDTDGDLVIPAFSNTTFTGTLTVTGDNNEGTLVSWGGDVLFIPTGDFSLIQDNDNFMTIQIEAQVQVDNNGDFGVWTVHEEA